MNNLFTIPKCQIIYFKICNKLISRQKTIFIELKKIIIMNVNILVHLFVHRKDKIHLYGYLRITINLLFQFLSSNFT